MVLLHIMIFLSLKISLYRNYANFKFVNDMKFSLQIYLKKETDLNTKFEEKKIGLVILTQILKIFTESEKLSIVTSLESEEHEYLSVVVCRSKL